MTIQENTLPNIPEGKWIRCNKCKNIIYIDDLNSNYNVCINCGFHFNIGVKTRINHIFDENSFVYMFEDILTTNPLEIDNYEEKINQNKDKSNLNEAVITGQGNICGKRVCAAIMDSNFMMGSMGCAVGEKITRLVEYATKRELPLIIFTASGGARMQEGIFSLMQMAKISQAIAKHDSKG